MRDYSVLSGMISNHSSEMRTAYDKGYKKGEEDCVVRYTNTIAQLEKAKAEAYENGMELAWECAKRISTLSPDMQEDIFKMRGEHFIFDNYSASEAIDIMDRYDAKEDVPDNEIRIGDEVIREDIGKPYVIIKFTEEGWALGMNEEGNIADVKLSIYKKTGRHFDQITEVIDGLKGKNDA